MGVEGRINSADAGARPAARRRGGAGRAEWPFADGIVGGPAGAAAIKRLGDLTVLELSGRPTLRCVSKAVGPSRAQRVLLLTLVEGEASFRGWDTRLRPIRPSDVLVLDSEYPLEVRGETGAILIGVTIPGHLLTPRFVSRERLRGGALRAHGGGVAALLSQLVAGLAGPGRVAPGAGVLADAIGGLVSAVLEDCWAQAADDGIIQRRVRTDQITQHLRRHFADPDLSPGAVAEALGMSRRYVHKLFAHEGRSFRQELIALRIDACLKGFGDDKQADKTIADIAFAAGYTDISQFNRHFRRVQGVTPSAARRSLLGKPRAGAGRRATRTTAALTGPR